MDGRPNEEKKMEWWCVDLGQAVHYSPVQLERLAEGFLRFTPDVVVGKNRLFLEMARTKKLFRLESLRQRVQIIAAREKLDSTHWKWGIGKTLPESWVQCRHKNLKPGLLLMDAIFDYIDPIQHFTLNRAQQDKINLFQALGLRTLDDLFKVPHEALLVRFGEVLDHFSKNYFDGARFPWVRFKPAVDLVEDSKWNADEWAIDSESLIFKIKPLVDRLMVRLYSQRKSLKQIEITLRLDSKAPDRVLNLSFTFPQTSSQLLIKLLREKISFEMQRNPLSDAIMSASLKVIEAAERDQRSLSFIFSEKEDESSEDLREKWMELISYLGTAFQVETTEHLLPENSWRKVQSPEVSKEKKLDQVSHLFQKRPLKLFNVPVVLSRIGFFLKKNHELWRIQEFSCEEKLSGYEWDVDLTAGFDRTYYRVKVETQTEPKQKEEWWIYKDELGKQLLLHGVYS